MTTINEHMLDLGSARWRELSQAHGTAEDIPRLLEALATLQGEEVRAQLWLGVWATLCPDDRVYSAAYAAAPHLLSIARSFGFDEIVAAAHVIAQVESNRHLPGAPPIPEDLVMAYAGVVESLPALVAECAVMRWDALTAQILSAALLAGKRQPGLARTILGLSPESQ
jgi:hypothetical protein